MIEMKNLSLCLVTYNDEKYIGGCLRNLKEYVDEMIVADIGSGDQTVALASQAGAKVFEVDWNDSFSSAMNFCMDHAAGRWVLFLHASETISGDDLKKLPPLLENPNAEGYLLHCAGPDRLKIFSPNSRLRLIRNRKEYRYCYRAFEQFPDALISNIENTYINILCPDNDKTWEITMRNRLLEQDITEYPTAQYINYVYGLSLFNAEQHEKSVKYFKNACDGLNPDWLFATHLYKCLSWSLMYLEHFEEALTTLGKAIDIFPLNTDFLVLRAETYRHLGSHDMGIRDLMRCLNTMKQPSRMVPCPETSAAIVWELLGGMMEHQVNLRQALACYQQAYSLNSRNSGLFEKICTLTVEADMPEALSGILGITLKQDIPHQIIAAAKAFLMLGQYERSLRLANHISNTDLEDQISDIRFNCRILLEKSQRAPVDLAVGSAGGSLLLLERIKRCWLRGETSEVEKLLKELDQVDDIDPSLKAIYRLIQTVLSRGKPTVGDLTPDATKEIGTLHNMLLFNGLKEKARALLPLLLHEEGEADFINLAVIWARCNDFDALKTIFEAILQDEEKAKFKRRVLQRLLRDRHLETAEKLLYLGSQPPSEEMTLALWSANRAKKLDVISRYLSNSRLESGASKRLPKYATPNGSLTDFFDAVRENAGAENSEKQLTCGEIHTQIGVIFEKKQKRAEALIAYFRALQWEPNQDAKEKMRAFWQEDSASSEAILQNMHWSAEGELFSGREDFVNYIHGLISFDNGEHEQAFSQFAKAGTTATGSPAAAYMLVILWLGEKEEATTALMNDIKATPELFVWCFSILKVYILRRLEKALEQNPYDGLLLGEKENVLNNIMPVAVYN